MTPIDTWKAAKSFINKLVVSSNNTQNAGYRINGQLFGLVTGLFGKEQPYEITSDRTDNENGYQFHILTQPSRSLPPIDYLCDSELEVRPRSLRLATSREAAKVRKLFLAKSVVFAHLGDARAKGLLDRQIEALAE
jgi:hypothetical protein